MRWQAIERFGRSFLNWTSKIVIADCKNMSWSLASLYPTFMTNQPRVERFQIVASQSHTRVHVFNIPCIKTWIRGWPLMMVIQFWGDGVVYQTVIQLRGDGAQCIRGDGAVYQTQTMASFGSPGVTILPHSTTSEFINVLTIPFNMCVYRDVTKYREIL